MKSRQTCKGGKGHHERSAMTQSIRTQSTTPDNDSLLTPAEVAKLFRVDPKTVTRWGKAGRISSIRTPGGHRRFRESEVRRLMEEEHVTSRPSGEAGSAA